MNAAEYEITDGYIGSYGVIWDRATDATLAAAIQKAAAYNDADEAMIVRRLESGASVRWGQSPNYYYDHSYAVIRRKRRPVEVEMVMCDCGHSVPRGQRMSASLGSSCPDCYDRMSD